MLDISTAKQILQRLKELTLTRAIQWEETADAGIFRVILDTGTLIVRPAFLEILDTEGREVEACGFSSLDAEGKQLLEEVFELARRSGLDTDMVVKNVLKELVSKTNR